MKRLFLIASLALVAGCNQETREVKYEKLPDELRDCKTFYIQDSKLANLYVMRCPNSTTSVQHQSGKQTIRTVTIDGVEYELKEKTKKVEQ